MHKMADILRGGYASGESGSTCAISLLEFDCCCAGYGENPRGKPFK